jgi:7-keto-8-aminopelargonate synthetase-like enzyme
MFVSSTPLPLPLANAALAALELHRRHPDLRTRLNRNATRVKSALRAAGVRFAEGPGPIVQILPPNANKAARLRRALLAAGVYPPFVRYPGGPSGGSFRFAISSEHTQAQLDKLAEVLCRVCRPGNLADDPVRSAPPLAGTGARHADHVGKGLADARRLR